MLGHEKQLKDEDSESKCVVIGTPYDATERTALKFGRRILGAAYFAKELPTVEFVDYTFVFPH